jgi:hypothetical protein
MNGVGGMNPYYVQTPSEGDFSIKQTNSYVIPCLNSHTLHSFENESKSYMSKNHESESFLYSYTSQFIVCLWHFNKPPQIVSLYALP